MLFRSVALRSHIDVSLVALDDNVDSTFASLRSDIDVSLASLDNNVDSTFASLRSDINVSLASLDDNVDSTFVALRSHIDVSLTSLDDNVDSTFDALRSHTDTTFGRYMSTFEIERNFAQIAHNHDSEYVKQDDFNWSNMSDKPTTYLSQYGREEITGSTGGDVITLMSFYTSGNPLDTFSFNVDGIYQQSGSNYSKTSTLLNAFTLNIDQSIQNSSLYHVLVNIDAGVLQSSETYHLPWSAMSRG